MKHWTLACLLSAALLAACSSSDNSKNASGTGSGVAPVGGYGAGGRDTPGEPNLLRLLVGTETAMTGAETGAGAIAGGVAIGAATSGAAALSARARSSAASAAACFSFMACCA